MEQEVKDLLKVIDQWESHKKTFESISAKLQDDLSSLDEGKRMEAIATIHRETGKFEMIFENVLLARDKVKEAMA